MPFLIETDVLLALISPRDKHHGEAIVLLEKLVGEIQLSPFSLVELDFLIKSGKIVVTDAVAFYNALSHLLSERNVALIPIEPLYYGEAISLRNRYARFTYFDSLHAAVTSIKGLQLISYDSEYSNIENLLYTHPAKYL